MEKYEKIGYKGFWKSLVMSSEVGKIVLYLRLLKCEERLAKKSNVLLKLFSYVIRRKRNQLGVLLGFHIPAGCFGEGLLIYHSGSIVVNANAKIGKNCVLHGENCIGNNGVSDDAPVIGDNCDIGIGAKIIGGVKLGNNVKIGANAVVTKSFLEDDIVLVGVPARKIVK